MEEEDNPSEISSQTLEDTTLLTEECHHDHHDQSWWQPTSTTANPADNKCYHIHDTLVQKLGPRPPLANIVAPLYINRK